MGSSLWQYQNYNAPVYYLFDKQITEYDISKANINILLDAGKLSLDEYERLLIADRMQRQYQIGCMIRDDPSLQESLNDGLARARESLFNQMDLEDSNVLHIAKDAVFVISAMNSMMPIDIQVSPHVVFTKRSEFTNYLRLNRFIHFYHSYSIFTGTSTYKIRGMNEEAQSLHKDYFTKALVEILNMRQLNGFKAAYECCRKWYHSICNHDVEVQFARRFDSLSRYDLRSDSEFSIFQANYLSNGAEIMVDPSYNLDLLSKIGNSLLCEAIQKR